MNPITGIFNAYSWFCDKAGKIMTCKGLLLGAFILTAAAFATAPAALAAGATNGQVLTSFWNILYSDSLTGAIGIDSFFNNAGRGAVALYNSVSTVAMSGFGAAMSGQPVLSALGSALTAPAIGA